MLSSGKNFSCKEQITWESNQLLSLGRLGSRECHEDLQLRPFLFCFKGPEVGAVCKDYLVPCSLYGFFFGNVSGAQTLFWELR